MRVVIGVTVAAVLLALPWSSPAHAETDAAIPDEARAVMALPPYANSLWSLRVVDAASGEVLIDLNSDVLVEPASVTKTYSSAAAWLAFGPDHRIVTPVVRTSGVRGRTLRGDLVLVAQGDITMGGQTGPDGRIVYTNFDHNDANAVPGATIADNNPLAGLVDLARQVKAAGISRVTGDVVIDDRLFAVQDLGNDGPVTPIVINNNLIDIVVTPGLAGAKAAVRLRPVVSPWRVLNRVMTSSSSSGAADIDVAVDEGRGLITVNGTIPQGSAPVLRVWNVQDPAAFARTAFIEALERVGVRVRAPAVGANDTSRLPSMRRVMAKPRVARLVGLPLSENIRYILKVSYNRGAQTQVCLLAVASDSRDCNDGLMAMAPIFAAFGIDPLQLSLVDGSGRPGNLVTPTSQTELQRLFFARPDAALWRDTLPVMGVDGSLAFVQRDAPSAGHVAAKTGTNVSGDWVNMRYRVETKALGGYITAKSGRQLAFSLIVNNAMYPTLDGIFQANEDLGRIATAIWEAY